MLINSGVEQLLCLMALPAFLAMILVAAIWVFRPLDQAAKNRKYPAQFTLADFLCLFFLVQLGMAPSILGNGEGWGLAIYAVIAFSLMWLFGQQTLSRAGIQNTGHRILFEALVIPGAICGIVAMPGLCVFAYSSYFDHFHQNVNHTIISFLGLIGVIVIMYFFGWLTRWLVAQAESDPSSSSPTSTTQ